jgi:hypothetical protein
MGITAAIIFGYVFSLIFKSKSKNNWLSIKSIYDRVH